jgi:hypothetical protein
MKGAPAMPELDAFIALIPSLLDEPKRLIGALMVAAGVGAFVYQVWNLWRVAQSQRWPSTHGRIVHSASCTLRNGPDVANTVRGSDIRYVYEVAGVEYHGNVVCLGGEFNTSLGGPAEQRLAQYPENEPVEVFYNPARPRQACLQREAQAPAFTILIGLVFVAIGAMLVSGVMG